MTGWRTAIGLFALTLTVCASPAERERRASADAFAQEWVEIIDAGDRERAWARTSKLTRDRVGRAPLLKLWFGRMRSLGARRNHEITVSWERKSDFLRGTPEGKYWEIQLRSDFEQRRDVLETLLLAWEDDAWRLLEYRLR